MNLVDAAILAWLITSALRGYAVGLVRQVLSFIGFVLGLFIGGYLALQVAQFFDGMARILFALVLIVITSGVLSGLGDRLAMGLLRKVHVRLAHVVDSSLGTLAGMTFVVVLSWLMASALMRLPFANLSFEIERSTIIGAVNTVLPAAPDLTGQLGRLVTPDGIPEVFVGPEPAADPAGLPVTPEVEAAVAKARASTVRIESFACGQIVTGSGFVAGPNHVVTNAHVVAGVREPIILNQGLRRPAVIVMFDPGTDIAVLRTAGRLPGRPLALTTDIQPRGSSVAALGYPGGGGFRASPAVILRSQVAVGRDIYGSSISSREIYALQADIRQGNSGGPVVLPDGSVAGVVFGKATTRDGVGYAVTARDIAGDLSRALSANAPVNSGRCL